MMTGNNRETPMTPAAPGSLVHLALAPESRLHIEQVCSAAELEFQQSQLELNREQGDDYVREVEGIILIYLCRRMIAFFEAVMSSQNDPAKIRAISDNYLIAITNDAFDRKHPLAVEENRLQMKAQFQAGALFAIRNSSTWAAFQQELLLYSNWYFQKGPGSKLQTPDVFTRNVEQLRLERRLSHEALALTMGCAKSTVIRHLVHGGRISKSTKAKYAAALKTSIGALERESR